MCRIANQLTRASGELLSIDPSHAMWSIWEAAKSAERRMITLLKPLSAMKSVFLLALLVAGCQTTDERIAADDHHCRSYGVAPGSAAYVQCRGNLDTNRANVAASERFASGGGLIGRIQAAAEK